MNTLIRLIKSARIRFMHWLKPSASYFLATRNLKPLSSKFGFDRGTPIDRFWIESFLSENSNRIRGICLEVTDATYTKKFGGSRVTRCDVLDINKNNTHATVIDDLRIMRTVPDNTYDCIILTHVLGLIDDLNAAMTHLNRILKPDGSALITSSCLGPVVSGSKAYWRFTVDGMRFLLEKHFPPRKIQICSYGNAFTGQCFWVGMAQEELTRKELTYNDPRFPCIVAAVATKPR